LPLAWYTANPVTRVAVNALVTQFAVPLTEAVPAATVDVAFVVAYPLRPQPYIAAFRAGWALRAEEVDIDGVTVEAYLRIQIQWLPGFQLGVLTGEIDLTDSQSIACLQQLRRYDPGTPACQDLLT
jgi:hypothetical protein